jgi:hypothetical protein
MARTLDWVLTWLILGFYVVSSVVLIFRLFTRKPEEPLRRLGWGSELSVLPARWRRWLLDEDRGRR